VIERGVGELIELKAERPYADVDAVVEELEQSNRVGGVNRWSAGGRIDNVHCGGGPDEEVAATIGAALDGGALGEGEGDDLVDVVGARFEIERLDGGEVGDGVGEEVWGRCEEEEGETGREELRSHGVSPVRDLEARP